MMTTDAFQYFAKMFATNRTMEDVMWYTRFPMYEHDAEMGAKPWWPPLSEVWRARERCSDLQDGRAGAAAWGEAWACLQRHYDEFRTAKQQRRK